MTSILEKLQNEEWQAAADAEAEARRAAEMYDALVTRLASDDEPPIEHVREVLRDAKKTSAELARDAADRRNEFTKQSQRNRLAELVAEAKRVIAAADAKLEAARLEHVASTQTARRVLAVTQQEAIFEVSGSLAISSTALQLLAELAGKSASEAFKS